MHPRPCTPRSLECTCIRAQVNGAPTKNLDELLAVVRDLPPGAPVRVMVQEIRGKQQMVTIRPDPHYWPTVECKRQVRVAQRVVLCVDCSHASVHACQHGQWLGEGC